jgi:hypothetical protein
MDACLVVPLTMAMGPIYEGLMCDSILMDFDLDLKKHEEKGNRLCNW